MNVSVMREKMKIYFGLSRMSHSVLDIGQPGLGAILALGAFPPYPTLLLGLLAAFSGFTCVFALNDLMDCKVDAERMEKHQRGFTNFDIDVVGIRHPIAQRVLSFPHAFAWVFVWGTLSLCIAFSLNPVCFLILVAAIALEITYCSLLRVTCWKTILSGGMVGIGALAGVFAVVKDPPVTFLLLFFFWAFCWEIGARNIPNDWTDLEEDIHLGIETIPVRYGRRLSSTVSFILLCLTVVLGFWLVLPVPLQNQTFFQIGSVATGAYFLIIPGWRWLRSQSMDDAMVLFNRACVYPAAMLLVAVMST
ncbi:MAG: prenyltransferase [Syntrophorhabdaceae bacterium PtaU1.Bin034]|jgi:4-hydroxybenzoate polyprenyltransferase|nr:MAG: prenyltransferase [Syntrophorhabdaceae bacterium PtaU1.Bin034]